MGEVEKGVGSEESGKQGENLGGGGGEGGGDRIKIGRMKENTVLNFCAVKFILNLICIVLTTIFWYF